MLCFKLERKIGGGIAPLQEVDAVICDYLDLPVHPNKYCLGWVDSIGFALAMGCTFDEIRDVVSDNPQNRISLLKIVDFLEHNFIPHCWRE